MHNQKMNVRKFLRHCWPYQNNFGGSLLYIRVCEVSAKQRVVESQPRCQNKKALSLLPTIHRYSDKKLRPVISLLFFLEN